MIVAYLMFGILKGQKEKTLVLLSMGNWNKLYMIYLHGRDYL